MGFFGERAKQGRIEVVVPQYDYDDNCSVDCPTGRIAAGLGIDPNGYCSVQKRLIVEKIAGLGLLAPTPDNICGGEESQGLTDAIFAAIQEEGLKNA